MLKPSPPSIGHGGDAIVRNSDSLYNLDPEDDFIDDSKLPKNKDTILRDMMRTPNAALKMPHFPVEKESAKVVKARQELRSEVELVSKAQEESHQLEDDIEKMTRQIKLLERQKMFAKHNSEHSENISSFGDDSEERNTRRPHE